MIILWWIRRGWILSWNGAEQDTNASAIASNQGVIKQHWKTWFLTIVLNKQENNGGEN